MDVSLPPGARAAARVLLMSERNRLHQCERYFVARTKERLLTLAKVDSYVIGYRWWGLTELEQSHEDFAPRRLAELLPAILCGEYPDPAIDCGV